MLEWNRINPVFTSMIVRENKLNIVAFDLTSFGASPACTFEKQKKKETTENTLVPQKSFHHFLSYYKIINLSVS